uniref:F-box only protein 13 n=1 Tax=Ananas comosus var. bracteatus TaxID=296719 RepID=A0A6V7PN57_ANACO|nr:unnamed protein product [Ananas comosus var. bracteatus]
MFRFLLSSSSSSSSFPPKETETETKTKEKRGRWTQKGAPRGRRGNHHYPAAPAASPWTSSATTCSSWCWRASPSPPSSASAASPSGGAPPPPPPPPPSSPPAPASPSGPPSSSSPTPSPTAPLLPRLLLLAMAPPSSSSPLLLPPTRHEPSSPPPPSIPVASSRGFVCLRSPSSGELTVSNPVTGSSRKIPPFDPPDLLAIAMASPSSPHDPSSYHLVLVYGASPTSPLGFRLPNRRLGRGDPLIPPQTHGLLRAPGPRDEPVYFLSKTGDVVAANMQRSPCKQYSSVFATENGDDVVYFLSHSGTVVGCNLTKRSFFEHPRLLPAYYEYSIDIALFRGELCAIVLSEFLETASLRVWRFARETMTWHQVAAMPPSMSHEFFGKKVDINCVGFKDWIFTCLNSGDFSSCVVYDLGRDQWVEIPKCRVDGEAKEFVCAFPLSPDWKLLFELFRLCRV